MPPKKVAKAKPKAKAKAAGPSKEEQEKVTAIFTQWDADKDGTMNMAELKNLVVSLGFPSGEVEPLFVQADLDKDGKVSVQEFLNWVFSTAPTAVQNFTKSGGAASKDDTENLEKMLGEVFQCFDADKDGLLERVELLDFSEQLYDKMGEVFNVRTRKETVKWFKEAGAEGDPATGMYLTYEKWRVAYLAALTEKAGCTIAEPKKLSEYLYANIAEKAFEICYPKPKAGEAPADGAADGGEVAAPGSPPEWPITIPFTDLEKAIKEAQRWERSVLVLSCGKDEVETFLSYRPVATCDCTKLMGEWLIGKSKSKEQVQEDASKALQLAMNSHGFCQPLHIRLATSAFDLKGFCDPMKFPSSFFSPALWTPEEALKCGLIDEAQKFNVEIEDNKKWKDFHVIITSKMDLDGCNTHLVERIPHFDELAIIIIDPASLS